MAERTAFEKMWQTRTDRRAFLLGGLALVGAGALTRVQARPRWADSPFSLGVASGDPAHDGVVLWTRLRPDPLNGGGMSPEPVEVRWEVADDESMRQHREAAAARRPTAAWAHSVHVEVDGLKADRVVLVPLSRRRRDEPDRPHAHAAEAGRRRRTACGSRSPPASTTRPVSSRPTATWPPRTSTSCSTWATTSTRARPRRPGAQAPGSRDHDAARTTGTATRSTSSIRICRRRTRRFPWIVTPDDHEVENNYAGDISEQNDPRDGVPGAPRGGVPGLLRAHAAPPAIRAERAGDSAVPPVHLRQARVVLRARHAAVPQRSAVRRRPEGAVPGRGRSAGDACSAPAQERWLFDAAGRARRGNGTCCRSR